MPKREVFGRLPRELSLDVSVGVHILLVVEQSSLESQSRGCAKTVSTDTYGIILPPEWTVSDLSAAFKPTTATVPTVCLLPWRCS